jgi:predicted O-methyltransferase YrrM
MKKWHDLEGWFDYEPLYHHVGKKYQNATFVEIGSWLGKSAAFLAESSFKNKNKIYCIDTWNGLDQDYMDKVKQKYNKNSIFEIFQDGISDCGFSSVIEPIVSISWEAAIKFSDKSCDFIFIDADHTYESVFKDISAWYPKLKLSGVLAGHDIFAPDIQKACSDALIQFGKTWRQEGSCWIMN